MTKAQMDDPESDRRSETCSAIFNVQTSRCIQ